MLISLREHDMLVQEDGETRRSHDEEVTAMDIDLPFALASDDGSRLDAIVSWTHGLGGRAHCLLRMFPATRPPVAVVSEIRSNPPSRGLIDDMPAVAAATLKVAAAAGTPVDPTAVVWLAHHGSFSYHDAFDPDTFTLVALHWDDGRYRDPLDHALLDPAAVSALLNGAELPPVPQSLARLGWPD